MFHTLRRQRHGFDIWPGFVDALSALLMVIIFVLMTFVLSQFYLSHVLSTREKTVAEQSTEITALSKKLEQEQLSKEELEKLVSGLQLEIKTTVTSKDDAFAQIATLRDELKKLQDLLSSEETAHHEQKTLNTTMLADIAKKVDELNALQSSYTTLKETHEKVVSKNREGFGHFRSEFLAKLQRVVGERSDIRIVGDRFVFQSEVFFDLASADLGKDGKKQLDELAKALRDIATKIPPDVKWLLRVDGHTDRLPIKNTAYASNWELSAARALSVVRYLISQGVPPERLVAAGFGEFQPLIENTKDERELARNRRIEFKLDQR